jgi:hypothetical protein
MSFHEELIHLINCHSMENGSNTPDYLLASFLMGCLNVFNDTVRYRDMWYLGGDVHYPGKEAIDKVNEVNHENNNMD